MARLVFTGDIGFDKYMNGKWEDETLVDAGALSFLRSGDHLIVNVEGPLSDGKKNQVEGQAGSLVHAMHPDAANFLRRIGADTWCLVNNHIMDAGGAGLADTLKLARDNHVCTFGAGMNIDEARKPVLFDDAGGIGIIGVGYQRACRKAGCDTPGCFSWSDMDGIKEAIDAIKRTCRWCIVVSHGGEEFTSLPSPYTRDRYLAYLSMGADIVVGHHPHVPMNYELFPGKAIFYSLGNFVFDTDYQRSQYHTEEGLFLGLDFSEDAFSFEGYGIRIDREKEKIVSAPLPAIFTHVPEDEYLKLIPLSTKAFIEATKRQQIYLHPEKYSDNTGEEEWHENFYEPLRSGRVPGECLDFQILVPLAEKEKDKAWESSHLEIVKKYILDML